ncbi:hypothetical protein [Dokdonella sp.]|uniref:hypothetical protein n=1 Tax=Dokdonella sp. TaxID=2291710 RepID=UPI003C43B3CE
MFYAIIAAILAAGLASVTTLQAAVSAPEILIEFPGDSSSNNRNLELKIGRALNESGEIVSSAYFTLYSSETQSSTLWVTDGTLEGTHLAAPYRISGNQAIAADVGLFFTAYDGSDVLQIFRTNGPGSSVLTLTQESVLTTSLKGVIGNDVVLARPGPSGQTAAWRLDGMNGAPSLLGLLPGMGVEWAVSNQHIEAISYDAGVGYGITSLPGDGFQPFAIPATPPNTYWDYPHRMGAGTRITCFKAFTHYSAVDIRQELNCTDGTAQGTRIPTPVAGEAGVPLLDSVLFHPLGDRLLVQGVGGNLPFRGSPTITDGTDAGTFPLLDGSFGDWSPCSNDRSGSLYLAANSNTVGQQLWITDGSLVGSRLVMNLPSSGSSCPRKGTTLQGSSMAYLQLGQTLIQSDGTPAGTIPVPGSPA